MDRRDFLAGTAATAALALRPVFALAEVSIGAASITTVSDGSLLLPGDFAFAGMPEDELGDVLAQRGVSRSRLTPECNLALYRDDTNTVLFDAGSGPDFMPSAGRLIDSLDAIGLTPDDVSHVVFTHAHPDHIWGLLDDFDEPVFPQARYLMGRREWDYWWNPETVATIGQARAAFAAGARRRMEGIEAGVERFDDGEEILPGIAAFATYGHTPGHMSFEIRNGSDTAIVLGDAIANDHVAIARPDWPSQSDQDPATAVHARKRLLDRLAGEQSLAIGFHFSGGGIGRLDRTGTEFQFTQET